MGKIKARYIVIPVLVLSLIGGVVSAAVEKQNEDTTVNVCKVSKANEKRMLGYLDVGGSDFVGTLKKGSIQNAKVNEDLKIESVLVSKGDSVKKGDRLFTYDLQSMRIALAEAENTLSTCENNIKVANNELAVLKKLQPSENAPKTVANDDDGQPEEQPKVETPDVPTPAVPEFKYDKLITPKSQYIDGSGTADEPFVYYVGEDTVVSKDALLTLCPEGEEAKYALFYVCDETGTPKYARLVDGNKIDRENAENWNVNDGVTVDPTGNALFDGGSAGFASFIFKSETPGGMSDVDLSQLEGGEGYEGMEELFGFSEENAQPQQEQQNNTAQDTASDEITEKDNYIYSKDELKKMISDKEKELERLDLEKRQYEIDVTKANKTLEIGAEVANFDGRVTFVAKDLKHLSDSGAYVTVASSSGMSVISYIGEFSLSDIDIGTKMTLTDYDNGNNYTGTVTSISDTPSQTDQFGNEDTTQSYYEFVVTVNETFELKEDGSVSMDILKEDNTERICLYAVFVRSEGSKHYVMVANKDNVIEKRYVEVEKILYEMVIVTGGLSMDDRIAIAYGKTKEGLKAVDADYETIIYGSGMFY